MNADQLRAKLATAQEHLEAALTAKQNAERLSATARELGGGIPGFGGSGSQRAARQVQGAQGRAFEAHRDADARIAKWSHRVASLKQRIAELERTTFTAEDLQGVTHVRTRTGWHKVVSVNAKTVTVETPYSWTDRILIETITGHHTIGEES